MLRSNMYSASAADVWNLFRDYVEGNPSAIVLAVSGESLGDAARDALAKSFASFGYGKDVCAFATLVPRSDEEPELDAQALFMLVEGLDPVCLVCADDAAARALEAAYRTTLKRKAAVRIFGRSAVVFRSLDALMESPEGKQQAWAVLKSFPRRG